MTKHSRIEKISHDDGSYTVNQYSVERGFFLDHETLESSTKVEHKEEEEGESGLATTVACSIAIMAITGIPTF